MTYQIITKAQQQRSDWTGGSTLQLQIHPADATLAERNFAWRLSSAMVNQGGAFSQFQGFGRWLGVRRGAGLSLEIDNHRLDVREKSHMLWFSGNANTTAELVDGPVVDINLILAAGWQGGMQALEFTREKYRLQVSSVAEEFLLYVDAGSLLLTLAHQQLRLEMGEVLRCKVQDLDPQNLFAQASGDSASGVLAWVAPL
jgi:environmental stress-induced protein Ves